MVLRREADLVYELQKILLEDGSRRFVKNGGRRRSLTTRLGALRVRLQRVLDKVTGETYTPFSRAANLGRRRYTWELRAAAMEEATRTTYREAERSIWMATRVRVPHRTIWDFEQEFAPAAEAIHRAMPPRIEGGVHIPDTTFVRGQKSGTHHQVHVAVLQDPEDHHCELVNVEVGGPSRRVLDGEDVRKMVSDGDQSLRTIPALAAGLCHLHFLRQVQAAMVTPTGRLLTPLERARWVRPLEGCLAHLRNSVRKHLQDGDREAIAHRVRTTLGEMEAVAGQLQERGYLQAAQTVRTDGKATVVFAEMAVRGHWMPATSNGVERIMGTVAHR